MKLKIHHPKKSFTVLRHTLCWNKLLLKVIVLHKKTFFQGLTKPFCCNIYDSKFIAYAS